MRAQISAKRCVKRGVTRNGRFTTHERIKGVGIVFLSSSKGREGFPRRLREAGGGGGGQKATVRFRQNLRGNGEQAEQKAQCCWGEKS